MKKLIKNYTTQIPTYKTVAEIQKMLGENGATGIAFDYDGKGLMTAVYFRIHYKDRELPFRLPAKPEQVYNALFADKRGAWSYKDARMEQATMIAWRIVKVWLEAQITLVNLDQAKMEEVFLPYLVVGDKLTLYESMAERGMLLPSGDQNNAPTP